MKQDNTLNILRSAYKKILLNGEETVWGYPQGREQMEILRMVLWLCMNLGFCGEEGQKLIEGYSYREIAETLDENVNVNTAKSRALYDMGRLKRLIGRDTLEKLVKNRLDSDSTQELRQILKKEMDKREDNRVDFLNGLVVNLPVKKNIEAIRELEEKDREFLQMLFRGYGKAVMKERVQKISDNILGYLLYLSEVKDPEGELRKEDLELYRFMEKYAYGKR